jgi:acyl CoA:acetate/3-ketoacid CoA transferase alpha subunit
VARDVSKTAEETFRLRENEGQNKVISLEKAVRKNVEPGMKLYVSAEGGAAICEIIRQYWGKAPGFTLIQPIVSDHSLNLIHCGLIKRLVMASGSTFYPAPGPSPVIQSAFMKKTVEFENWSFYTLYLRMMAGALGVAFMPTKSIVGSSLAEELRDSFKVIDDPFGHKHKLGVVTSLNPDISIVHAWAADPYGNVVQTAPCMDGGWPARAAKNGVMVTVEKIVSTEFIRRHSSFVKIPGYMVNSVSVAPLGAHPRGLLNPVGIPEFEAYGDDYEFMSHYRDASQNPDSLNTWIQNWVLNCKNHSDYIRKLGVPRVTALKGKANRDIWTYELGSAPKDLFIGEEYNATEMMVIAAAREIGEIVTKKSHRVIVTGVGAGALAGWLAYYQLKNRNYDVELCQGGALYGHSPRPGDPFALGFSHMATCKMLTDIIDGYGAIICGENTRALGVLGAGEIDQYGNINTTYVGDRGFFIGAGGGNDIANGAREVVVVARQSRGRFVEKVPYISCCGDKVCLLSQNIWQHQSHKKTRQLRRLGSDVAGISR